MPAAWWVVDAARHRRLGVDVVARARAGRHAGRRRVLRRCRHHRDAGERPGTRGRRRGPGTPRAARPARARPRVVHRYEGGELTRRRSTTCVPGDLLLVQPGEVVPVDGLVENATSPSSTRARSPASRCRSSALPVTRSAAASVNAGGPFDLRGDHDARPRAPTPASCGSSPRREASSAPFVRLADRYAGVFLAVSARARRAAWAISGDLVRAVAVLVVATPCPLILAAPVAIVSGLSRAARRGVVVKGGGGARAARRAARSCCSTRPARSPPGRPRCRRRRHRRRHRPPTRCCGWPRRSTRSRRTCSPRRSCAAARARGARRCAADDVEEVPGHGVRGVVDGHRVAVGKASWVVHAAAGCRGCASRPAPGRARRASLHDLRRGRRRARSARCSSTTRSAPTPPARFGSCAATASGGS